MTVHCAPVYTEPWFHLTSDLDVSSGGECPSTVNTTKQFVCYLSDFRLQLDAERLPKCDESACLVAILRGQT